MLGEARSRGVTIRSAVAGRERWQVDALRAEPRYAVAVERDLSRYEPIRHVRANPLTGRLLVAYDAGVPRTHVRNRVDAALGVDEVDDADFDAWRASWPNGYDRRPQDEAVDQARVRLILSGALLAGLVVDRVLIGGAPLAGAPMLVTASAVVTIFNGYSTLRDAFDRVTSIAGVSGQTVLTSAHLALLIAAESLSGVSALFVAHAGEWLEKRAIRDSRNHLLVLDDGLPLPPPRPPRPESAVFTTMSNAALLASGGTFVATGDARRALAMLVGASHSAASESRTTARALALRHAIAEGILFRDPDTVTELPAPAALVFDGIAPLRNAVLADGELLLRAGAMRTILLSRVHEELAREVALRAGIDEWHGGFTVDDKLEAIAMLRRQGLAPVVVAGDAEADPLVLEASDLGIALAGSTSPEAVRAADVVLTRDGLHHVARALALISRAGGVIRQNDWMSGLTGAAGFTAAAFGRLNAANAAEIHHYARLAMELNSLRLALPS
ncbi:MAG: manganese-transporting P-type ATPase [Thermoanaerobaculia bacterium]|jgi:cation transport ATPase|nr:manganese-transporting P-type ATPase [Thermoanaerobaculia bacterium]